MGKTSERTRAIHSAFGPRLWQTFRWRLLIMILLIVLPALAVTVYLNFQQRAHERTRLTDHAAAISALVAANEANFIKNTQQLLDTLTQFPFLLLSTNREFAATHFINLRKLSPDYANFGLIETNGILFCAAERTNAGVYLGDRYYFKRVLETKTFSVGRFQTGRVTGVPTVNFGQPVFDEHGTLARVLYASLKLEPLSRQLREIQLPPHASVLLLDATGTMMVRHPENDGPGGETLLDAAALQQILASPGGNLEVIGKDRVSRFYSVTPVASGNERPLLVIVEVPSTVLFGPANAALTRTLSLLALVALLIWLLVQAYAKRFFLQPVNTLAKTARRFADGDLSARTGRPAGAAELTELAATLDEMAERVQIRTAELLQANESLRNQIREREQAEQRLAEQEREKKVLEEKFLRAQRMESIGALAGGVAHDLNNALVPIVMGAEMLREFADDPREREKLIALIEASGKRCTAMVNQIVRFARGNRGATGPVSVSQLLGEMAKIATETFPKSINVQFELPESLLAVSAEPTELHQILMNLCVNARDAMPQGGTLQLCGENFKLAEQFAPAGLNPGQYVKIVVADTGTGMAPEVRQRIFEPFFTTKTPEKGTGLGLSTVFNLVKKHGGSIEVETEPGRGTRFNIYLPAVTTAVPDSSVSALEALPPGSGELILLADDEKAIVELGRSALENYRYRVLCAANGLQAVSSFEAYKDEIKLVIVDTDMPFLNGVAAIEAMRRISPGLPAILASATKVETTHFSRSDLADITRLSKPYDVHLLLRAVNSALHKTQQST